MILNPLSVDFNFKILVQADEANEPVAAKDCHDRHVPGVFQALLESLVRSRWMRGVRTIAGVAVKVCQEFVTELFQLDEQIVRGGHVRHNAQFVPTLVRKFGPLVEDQYTFDFSTGDEEELLVLVRSQLFEALVQEPGTDSVAFGPIRAAGSILCSDSFQALQEVIGLENVMDQPVHLVPAAHSNTKPAKQLFTFLDEGHPFLFKMSCFHCS
jgi:hypothetical protein